MQVVPLFADDTEGKKIGEYDADAQIHAGWLLAHVSLLSLTLALTLTLTLTMQAGCSHTRAHTLAAASHR